MLAKLGKKAFDSEDWVFEIKWDGYRAIADLRNSEPLFYSRNGISYQDKFESLFEELKKQNQKMVIDGEIVAYDKNGKTNFQLLQQAGENPDTALVYQVFDLLWLNGHSTESLNLLERKELLKEALIETTMIKFSEHIPAIGIEFFEQIKKMNLEGMMAKKKDSIYHRNQRSEDWLKIKITNTEEVVIGGFTEPKGSREYFGSLILGRYKEGKLVYSGHTGTGFDQEKLKEIYEILKPLIVKNSPFSSTPKTNAPATWVKPEIVCEIKFSEETKDGVFRHPVFLRLRQDKDPKEITQNSNQMKSKVDKKTAKSNKEITLNHRKLKLTNQDKIYFPENGITKGEIIEYYQSVSKFILPHLKNRPLSLNRFPNGIEEDGFYQKDAGEHIPEWIKTFEIYSESTEKNIDYIYCNDKSTLAYLNNLGCIDFNPWSSTVQNLENPDYLILDLDPSPKNSFDDVIETALQTKILLDEIGIEGFPKTSGSSGIHIFLPAKKKYSYEQIKDFAHILMKKLNERLPELTTLERSLKKRDKDKIYLDYLQNRAGQTVASVYSVRPKKDAPVSMPLEWNEVLPGLRPEDFNIYNALGRIEKKGDLFKPVLGKGFDMNKALKNLEAIA
ncbi:MAG TPA: DNA ligase D [Moheibacter sp.]|nr:DNA ligase D [Moheibacter sp.]